ARNAVRLEIDDGLIVEFELAVDHGVAQVEFELTPLLHARVHFGLEEAIEAAALGLGAIEGEIGVLHERVGIGTVRRGKRNADAGADDDLVARKLIGRRERLDEARRERSHIGGILRQYQNNRKLVAAKARHEILFADTGLHASR